METFENLSLGDFIYWTIAFIFSIFYSAFAFKIHLVSKELRELQKATRNYFWFIHQWWFNFVGCISGWIILWLMFPSLYQCFNTQSLGLLSIVDIILLLIALLGITGHLPLTLFGIARSSNKIVNRISGN